VRGLSCPYCGQDAMSLSRKMFLGRHTDVRCKSCGRKVGVNAGSMVVAYVPFGIAFLAAIAIDPLWIRIVVLAAGAVISLLLWWFWLPLQERD
jgi:hypothetical protein